MTTRWRRALHNMPRLAPALAPALFFGLGIGVTLALRHRFFANALLAVLALMWAALVVQRRPARPLIVQSERAQPPLEEAAERLRLRMMLDQTPAPLVLFDADGALRAVNRAARTLFQSDDLIVPPPPALAEAMSAQLPGNRAVLRLISGQGSAPERSYALQVAIVGGAGVTLRLGVLTDIQSELQASEAAALRQLLQLLSHELMNSLTPVASLAESAHTILVEEGATGLGKVTEALEVIHRRTRGLDGFVRGYRALARLPPPTLAPASVAGLLADAASLFRTRWEAHDLKLFVSEPEPDFIIHCDAAQISQALLNLLANAAESTFSNQADTPRQVSLAASAEGNGVAILISDTGTGIAAGEEETIFRPFFTTKLGGDGIGLALARQIASAHGGTLELLPTGPAKGTTFAFSIWQPTIS